MLGGETLIYKETPIEGAFQVESEPVADERGYLARFFCADEFERHGLNPSVSQCSISHNLSEATLRGLHYQESPHQECKLVRCTRGAIWDIILDLRPQASSYLQWWGINFPANAGVALYIPEGVAHGFLTLEPSTEVEYQMSRPYVAQSARGVRWDDPAFDIRWPFPPRVISERDRTYPDFQQ